MLKKTCVIPTKIVLLRMLTLINISMQICSIVKKEKKRKYDLLISLLLLIKWALSHVYF